VRLLHAAGRRGRLPRRLRSDHKIENRQQI
jgi:hypothetical protein